MRSFSRALLAVAAVGCAHVPSAESPAKTTPEKFVAVTGSHLPQRVDPRTGLPETASPVRIYTRQDLAGTGLADTAAALRTLEPALYGP